MHAWIHARTGTPLLPPLPHTHRQTHPPTHPHTQTHTRYTHTQRGMRTRSYPCDTIRQREVQSYFLFSVRRRGEILWNNYWNISVTEIYRKISSYTECSLKYNKKVSSSVCLRAEKEHKEVTFQALCVLSAMFTCRVLRTRTQCRFGSWSMVQILRYYKCNNC